MAGKTSFNDVPEQLNLKQRPWNTQGIGDLMTMNFLYTASDWQAGMDPRVLSGVQERVNKDITCVLIERCWAIETLPGYVLSYRDKKKLKWLFREPGLDTLISEHSFIEPHSQQVLEVRPRPGTETPTGERAKKACHAVGIKGVVRVEMFTRYGINTVLSATESHEFLAPLHDRMSEVQGKEPVTTFLTKRPAKMFEYIDVLGRGREALEEFQKQHGLTWTENDVRTLLRIARERDRNLTDMEGFQHNATGCDHSRHPFVKKPHVLDGTLMDQSLMEIFLEPVKRHPGNSILAACDDSSAIRGAIVRILVPTKSGRYVARLEYVHLTATAETHNHPCLNASYQGALTCLGGWLRDLMCAGQGSMIGSAGYGLYLDHLRIPGYEMPWEMDGPKVPDVYENSLQIALGATRGMSDYGDCFGIPTNLSKFGTCGFWVRSRNKDGSITKRYVGYMKPIVFGTGGGSMLAKHVRTFAPSIGEIVYLVGPPARRVGIGGGSASSKVADPGNAALDFTSVQRGDAAEQQGLYRAMLGFIWLPKSIIRAVRDLGAGGCCNAITELLESQDKRCKGGGVIYINRIPCADPTMNWMELWVCESQERLAVRVKAKDAKQFERICKREGCTFARVGEVTGSGRIVVIDETDPETLLVDFKLADILHDNSKSDLVLEREERILEPLSIDEKLMFREVMMDRMLRLFGVASNGFFTNHVDHTVGGRTVAFQNAGPAQLPIRNYSLDVLSALDLVGSAKSIGEAMLVGLIDVKAMARMALGRSLMGLLGVVTDSVEKIRYQGNWMFSKSGPGEGARVVDAARALRDALLILKTAIDGGKDSGSMAVRNAYYALEDAYYTVHAPLQLLLTAYVKVKDVRRTVSPDLKTTGGTLIHVDVAQGQRRLGGTSFAQVLGQVGNECPDADIAHVGKVYKEVHRLVRRGAVASINNFDGAGLAVCVAKMAMAGCRGVRIETREDGRSAFETLMNGELGAIIETDSPKWVMRELAKAGIACSVVGEVRGVGENITISHNGEVVLDEPIAKVRSKWEETSLKLEEVDSEHGTKFEYVQKARQASAETRIPKWRLTYDPEFKPIRLKKGKRRPKACVLRDISTNGDDEMRVALKLAGFDVYDVTMTDLASGRLKSFRKFQLIVFPGGFSNGDVLGAGKVWAGRILFNARIKKMFKEYLKRPDTLILGVCNGDQVIDHLGLFPKVWVDGKLQGPVMARNKSHRFEARFVSVYIPGAMKSSPFLSSMAGSVLGALAANGEGFFDGSREMLMQLLRQGGVALQYANSDGFPTESYPANPSGTPFGVAGVTSHNQRVLAVMPHGIDRLSAGCVEGNAMAWQHLWPWLPEECKNLKASPWHEMGRNAFNWCVKHQVN